MKKQSSQWWRWPLLPFAAIGGGLLGSFCFVMLQWLIMKFQGDFHEDGWWYNYILPLLSSAVFGWLYVYITFTVAPKGKVIAGVVMTTLLGVITVVSIGVFWYAKHVPLAYSIQQTVGVLVSFSAAIVGLIQLKNEHKNLDPSHVSE
jgi:uncharacterized membrane-anchored protein